ncbi:oligopeptidase B protein, putative [Trypanosoma brucei gambiense DAL972]|uniref:Prolyl endopeptidase-like n=1 Tax=Trypanosoma brucei gambiense (strain MHOM/CI/86/DAL972) TaxID=679716 RepID=C9ZTC4_TRYB9|nr:oligopeptidase B protein, putative [Trypanosoma brucei gambiense DAL972]CBH12659.1 oligopeptidase B protein, putative [Trypanosoma brucei gambiense DAL972]|eukprot:XP_011774939.1 oligopeptidase B protein, putative [Trypanosoma brucei gambiense DAL972]
MTALYPWVPTSNAMYAFGRRLVNRFFPQVRNVYPLTFLDGPLPEEVPQSLLLHGRNDQPDPFKYMEDLFDRRTQSYVRQEQRHFTLVDSKFDFKHNKARLWAELDAKVVITSREGGFDKGEERIGDYIYFTRVVPGGDPNAIGFYRKRFGEVDLLAEELINPSALQQHFGYAHCNVGVCRVSQDGKYLAYTLSVGGGDRYICHVRSIDNASLFHVIRGRNIVSIEFGSDNQFYFTESNELNRPNAVIMQEIRPGVLPPPVELYRDDDEQFFVDVRKTKDNAYIVITSDSKVKCSALVLPASFPKIPREMQAFFPDARPVEIAGKGSWNWLEHYMGHFLMVVGDRGPNHRVVYAREEVVLKYGMDAEWKELVPHRDDVQIVDIDLFHDHIVLYESHFAFERINHIRIIKCGKGIDDTARRSRADDLVIHFPPLACVTPGLNKNFNQDSISFVYSSLCQPSKDCVFNFNSEMTSGKCRMCSPEAIFTQRQSEQFTPWDYMWPYTIYRDVCVSKDGTQVPITICHRRDAFVQEATDFEAQPNTPKHCFIYVYGSYGEVPSMHFQLAPYMWMLRRRWTVAFAHVRGGGELPNWAEQGRGEKKINAVHDFIACCEHMVNMGYTKPELMVAAGNSAGCVPIAAAMNMRGCGLFGNVLMRSPFLDVISTMVDPDLPLSLAEQDDWGDPLNSPKDYTRLLHYDPYHNINDRVTYPGMMVSVCLDDDRVPPWNSLKYVAKLRQQRRRKGVDPVEKPLILRVRSSGGHYIWNDTENLCEELSFLCSQLDLEGPGKVLNDMDIMTHMHNLTVTGAMDHDDQEKVFLKWDNWERERIDYHVKLHNFDWEPNFRKLKAEKQPFFWVPTDSELHQSKVDEMFRAKERDIRERGKSEAKTGSTGRAMGENKWASENGRK